MQNFSQRFHRIRQLAIREIGSWPETKHVATVVGSHASLAQETTYFLGICRVQSEKPTDSIEVNQSVAGDDLRIRVEPVERSSEKPDLMLAHFT